MPDGTGPQQNQLLAALPAVERERIFPPIGWCVNSAWNRGFLADDGFPEVGRIAEIGSRL